MAVGVFYWSKLMSKKAPNKYFAPIIIAGITVGFFVSAYKFILQNRKSIQQHTLMLKEYRLRQLKVVMRMNLMKNNTKVYSVE